MRLALIGLGKMGFNMMKRLVWDNHEPYVFDLNKEVLEQAKEFNVKTFDDINTLIEKLRKVEKNLVVWVMVPSGKATENVMQILNDNLIEGDIVIDGGNSNYKETMKRAEEFLEKGIDLLDCGTSGGIWGLKNGYCMMIGGQVEAFAKTEGLYKSLAQDKGYLYVGPSGSGHYVKMVHNGIEYAMMGAFGEGFDLLKSKEEFNLDLYKISQLWQHGSVIDSWLLELCSKAFEEEGRELSQIAGYVQDSGEGRWTVIDGIEERVSTPLIALSLMQRFRSRREETFNDKVVAALRKQFGGHSVKKVDSNE